jgi:hypothetical protein
MWPIAGDIKRGTPRQIAPCSVRGKRRFAELPFVTENIGDRIGESGIDCPIVCRMLTARICWFEYALDRQNNHWRCHGQKKGRVQWPAELGVVWKAFIDHRQQVLNEVLAAHGNIAAVVIGGGHR